METAVEYLVEKLKEYNHLSYDEQSWIFQQAKEMEKEQIMDAVNFGDARGKITTYSTAEQYYNETYSSGRTESVKSE